MLERRTALAATRASQPEEQIDLRCREVLLTVIGGDDQRGRQLDLVHEFVVLKWVSLLLRHALTSLPWLRVL